MPPLGLRVRRRASAFATACLLGAAHLLALVAMASLQAQAPAPASAATVTAALLSDPHLDPFRDPAKAKRLAIAPVSQWAEILAEASSADAAAQFASLQKSCNEKLTDADASLELSAFDDAARAHPEVVLVAGDMLVHAFGCRYRTLLDPSGTDIAGLAEFAAKAVEFQLAQLQQRFPGTPIHFAPGNNDTDCEDYTLDDNSRFLNRLTDAVSAGWQGISPHDRNSARQDFKRLGSYSLPLSASVPNTRVIVLDDLYLSSDYKGTCGKRANRTSADALLTWVGAQFAEARRTHQAVWVLAHIPPEVNVYRTYLHPHDICHGEAPASFLNDDALANLLVQYADTVRVFISGHTHVDEIHLIEGTNLKSATVSLKTIPSISPISTNAPAYLLARIDPKTATLLNYSKRIATTMNAATIGSNAPSASARWQWSTAYDFSDQYHEPAFTSGSVSDLLHRWQNEPDASAKQVEAYQTSLASGLRLLALRLSWPQQLCAMLHSSAAGFTACACSAQGGLLPPVQNAK